MNHSNILVFDIETIPDLESGRKIYGFHDLTDEQVVQAMLQSRRQQTEGAEFVRHHLHRIVAISAVLYTPSRTHPLEVWSLGECDSTEAELLERFFKGIERYTPTLVSWNGSGFDLPVIHYRSLLQGVRATAYWKTDGDFKWDNYLNRYHSRHTDLMDVLSGFQGRSSAPLDEIAVMLGLPGKMGMSGHKVCSAYLNGDIAGIRNYCETDVLNTYLVYLRFLWISGHLEGGAYEARCQQVEDYLKASDKPHLQEFLGKWKG